jgi:UDP-2,3-diacylglucosamine pyrophosphatase LpxH
MMMPLRRFSGFSLGNFHLVDKLLLDLEGKKAWFFHGDVFDASIQYSRWLARLGGYGYSLLILINVMINFVLSKLGKEKMSFSKKVKNNVKKAVSYINDFEVNAAEIAIERAYDYVVCGHIHNPQIRTVKNEKGQVVYLNSGDWIEHLSAL